MCILKVNVYEVPYAWRSEYGVLIQDLIRQYVVEVTNVFFELCSKHVIIQSLPREDIGLDLITSDSNYSK